MAEVVELTDALIFREEELEHTLAALKATKDEANSLQVRTDEAPLLMPIKCMTALPRLASAAQIVQAKQSVLSGKP